MTAPAACAACNHHVRCVSTAIDAPEAASADPCISQRVDDTFRKAQTERRATQLLTPGEGSSPSQLDQPSRRGCGAVPSRWASTGVPGASGAKKRLAAEPRARRAPLTIFFRSDWTISAPSCTLRRNKSQDLGHVARTCAWSSLRSSRRSGRRPLLGCWPPCSAGCPGSGCRRRRAPA